MINDRTGVVENIRKLKELEDSIENSKNLGLIQSHRAIVRVGQAVLVRRMAKPQVTLHLLTDLLLITRPKDNKKESSLCTLVHRLVLFTPFKPNNNINNVNRLDILKNEGGGGSGGVFLFIGEKEGCICHLTYSDSGKRTTHARHTSCTHGARPPQHIRCTRSAVTAHALSTHGACAHSVYARTDSILLF